MSLRAFKQLNSMVPTHIQLVKQLSHDGSHFKYSLALLNKSGSRSAFDQSNYNYMKDYSFYNFNSSYKNWFELNPKEKLRFMDNYIKVHELTIPPYHKSSLKNCIKTMDKQNKDVNFMFFYLYQSLKENVDKQTDEQSLFDAEQQVILERDDYTDLLIKKY